MDTGPPHADAVDHEADGEHVALAVEGRELGDGEQRVGAEHLGHGPLGRVLREARRRGSRPGRACARRSPSACRGRPSRPWRARLVARAGRPPRRRSCPCRSRRGGRGRRRRPTGRSPRRRARRSARGGPPTGSSACAGGRRARRRSAPRGPAGKSSSRIASSPSPSPWRAWSARKTRSAEVRHTTSAGDPGRVELVGRRDHLGHDRPGPDERRPAARRRAARRT